MTHTIKGDQVADFGATVAGLPIRAIETRLIKNMREMNGSPDIADIVWILAELPWTDAADEGEQPGTMWWTKVAVMDPAGVVTVHLQAEPYDSGVFIYMPVFVDTPTLDEVLPNSDPRELAQLMKTMQPGHMMLRVIDPAGIPITVPGQGSFVEPHGQIFTLDAATGTQMVLAGVAEPVDPPKGWHR